MVLQIHHRKSRHVDEFSESEPEDFCQGIPAFRGMDMDSKTKDEPQIEQTDSEQNFAEISIEYDDDYDPPDEVKIVKEQDASDVDVGPVVQSKEEKDEPPQESVRHSPHRKRVHHRERDAPPSFWMPPSKISVPDSELPIKLNRLSKRPRTLLEMLLNKEMREERSELLQCVKYICEKNFFQQAE